MALTKWVIFYIIIIIIIKVKVMRSGNAVNITINKVKQRSEYPGTAQGVLLLRMGTIPNMISTNVSFRVTI